MKDLAVERANREEVSKSPSSVSGASPPSGAVGCWEVEVTAIDSSVVPALHTVSLVGFDNEVVVGTELREVVAIGGVSLSIGNRAALFFRPGDGRGMLITGSGSGDLSTILDHSHTGGSDLSPIGILG